MVRTIADLPFRERPVLELLHLEDEARLAPDPDYAGFGYARVPHLELAGAAGAGLGVDDALLIAVHSADDGEALADDVELEFVLDGGSVSVLLSAFLAGWLPRLPAGARAIVLVLCNPHRAVLPHPAAAGPLPVHYAEGDVESWLDPDGTLRLVAATWRTA